VNEQVKAEWVEETSPEERVRSVMAQSYSARTVTDIADAARTSTKTAQRYLRSLAESGFAEKISPPNRGESLYRRSPDSLVLAQASRIRADVDADRLAARVDEMQAEIHEYRERFGVDSPEDAAEQERNIDAETLRGWQTMRRNLAIAKVALALSDAVDIVPEQYR
jgi:predicted ArsR family transcriptional regulator